MQVHLPDDRDRAVEERLLVATMRGDGGPDKIVAVRRTMLIVDDHKSFRDAARALLEAEGFEVIGEAADGDEALAQAVRLRPDLVLVDVTLPDVDGFLVAALLAEIDPPPAVVLTSSHDAATFGTRVSESAAHGFLAKRDLSGAALAALLD